MNERIGFIGLGVMGAPMARHLHAAGYALSLHDVDRDAARELCESLPGSRLAACPREIAQVSDIVITMLPDGKVVREVALGANGLVEGFRFGSLLLDTSSSEPWITRETGSALAKRGVAMVDAPVSGAQWGAEKAELVFMAGGAGADLERVRPLLERMGRKIFHLGDLGAGHAMKCLNNLVTAMTFLATSEALAVGTRAGLDPAAMLEVLNESTGMSWVSQTHFHRRILSRSFDDPFKLELMAKDVSIACELARQSGVRVAVSSLGQELWNLASRAAGPGASVSELVRWVEQTTGVEIASPTPSRAPRGSAPA